MNAIFYVFSYNRAESLRNCIESAVICNPSARICVVDDRSNDPDTCALLEEISGNIEVIRSNATIDSRHGGLYANMQVALEHGSNFDLAIFMQDDMQFVRKFDQNYLEFLLSTTRINGRPRLVYPGFLKLRTISQLNLVSTPNSDGYVAFPVESTAGGFYSDVFAAQPRDLLQLAWCFRGTEKENEIEASMLLERMYYVHSPILMYVPRPVAYRGRKRDAGTRLIEWLSGFGRSAIDVMDEEDGAAFTSRDNSQFPIAEHFLSVNGRRDKIHPWLFSAYDLGNWVYPISNLSRDPAGYTIYQIQKNYSKIMKLIARVRDAGGRWK